MRKKKNRKLQLDKKVMQTLLCTRKLINQDVPSVCIEEILQICIIVSGFLPTLYDFHFDASTKKWTPWSSLVPKYIHNPDMKFIDILGNVIIVLLRVN